MRVLVTGATGFIGGHLARRLARFGHSVHALVRDHDRSRALQSAGIACRPGDISSRTTLLDAMRGMDAVFHVAGWYKVGVHDERAAVRTNVEGTQNVLEAMRASGVPRGVYTSTLAVNSDTHGLLVDETYRFEGRHISLYDRTKAEAHAIAEEYARDGLPLVIVQPGLVYGPGDTSSIGTMFRRFLTGKLPIVPTRTAFCWAHVEDVVSGHILAMDHGEAGRAYFLAGPVHTMDEALEGASALTGIPPPHRIPWILLRGASFAASGLQRLIQLAPEFTAEGLRVLAGTTYIGSGERARTELKWRPRPLRDGLVETLEYERRQIAQSVSSSI